MTLREEIVKVARLMEGAWQLFHSPDREADNQDEQVAEWLRNKEALLNELGTSEPLQYLRDSFGLKRWHLLLLMATALPAIDPRYRPLYRDFSPKNQSEPELDWLLNLLSANAAQKQDWCRELSDQCPLIRYRLLIAPEPAGQWLSGTLAIAPDTLAYLLEQPLELDHNQCLSPISEPAHKLLLPEAPVNSSCVQLVGAAGSGRTSLALWSARKEGRALFRLDDKRLWQFSEPTVVLKDIARFITLFRGELLWPAGLSSLMEHPSAIWLVQCWLKDCPHARLWFLEDKNIDWPTDFFALTPERRELDIPVASRSAELWQAIAAALPVSMNAVDWQTVARRYRLLPGDMAQVLNALGNEQAITTETVLQQCLQRTPLSLSGLASRVDPQCDLGDMVLAGDAARQLSELAERFRLRQTLCEMGICQVTGITALFSGLPGTGKTMAAEALASSLGLPLYKVNLANIASKWIGETEKHLSTLFDEVEHNNGILFFDEADAIFAKRSQVSSSHDKNANLGVSYLLQRIESFNGLLILATNFKGNLDKAFMRRLQFSVEFARPDVSERRELWARWLARVPVDKSIDSTELAKRLELTGAQIRNITQQSMALALADNEQQPLIRPTHFVQSIRREFQKHDNSFLVDQKLTGWLQPEAEVEE